ncbi:MAG TPA: PucR family transcriptional regulator ligand-binding domain-containing protein [Jatrophihabitantaceae bacterium]|jgi:purine catabolism regulator
MVTVANDRADEMRELPARRGQYGLPVRALLNVPSLRGTRVLAGAGGLDREVRRVNVMEVPDILPWVKPHELLLTTGFPLRAVPGESDDVAALCRLVSDLNERRLAAIAIKLGRYIDRLPDAVLQVAEGLDLPLLRVPDGVAFDDVITDVFTELLDRQSGALSRADELHRALAAIVLEGGDLPQIAEEVARLLDAAVLICTPDGRVQAEGGARESFAELPLFDATGRFRVEQLKLGMQPAPDGRPGELALVSIVAGGIDHGRIAAFRADAPLPAPGVQALERAATVAALAITKQLAVAAVESKYRGDYLRDVLVGAAGDPGAVVAHCASLGWNVDRPMVVVVAELDPDDPQRPIPPAPISLRSPQERFTAAWQQVMRPRDKAAPVVGFSSEVVALLPLEDGDKDAAAAMVDSVVTAVAGDRGGGRRSFCAGVSRLVLDPARIAEAYSEARKAVAVGRRVRGRGSVAHFDSLGVHRLLSLVPDAAELRSFAEETLGDLARDTAEAADLRHTLQTLLDTNLNVAETARILHFHYNTLRYRIGKLERIVGPFTTQAPLRLDVALALQVIEMRGI